LARPGRSLLLLCFGAAAESGAVGRVPFRFFYYYLCGVGLFTKKTRPACAGRFAYGRGRFNP
ncbi:hypothetical protein, partial [Comamonas sp. MYb69]|uniref:hypothetical protein n=1 Tax=Comamonas sp. MYb69 TaxID=1848650 RepID=UPI0030B7DA72